MEGEGGYHGGFPEEVLPRLSPEGPIGPRQAKAGTGRRVSRQAAAWTKAQGHEESMVGMTGSLVFLTVTDLFRGHQ